MSGLGHISEEEPGTCELCGKIEELRPYGPNGEKVCFECGMKNEPAARRQFLQHVVGLSSEEANQAATYMEGMKDFD
jgi:hypothetical protein